MKRALVLSFWSTVYLAAVAFIAVVTLLGVLDLRIGPVVWTVSGTHGIHAGDVVITAIAAFLVVLFTIGFVLAARQR